MDWWLSILPLQGKPAEDDILLAREVELSSAADAPDGSLLEIGVSGVASIYKEIKRMVKEVGMGLDEALPYLTTNPAKALNIYPQKGRIQEGADADILLLDKDLNLHTVIAGGKVMMEEGKLLRKGTYEK